MGVKPLPPGPFSFNKDDIYQQEIDEDYNILVEHENYEAHGAPYWVNDVQREITHSGESPLFTNKLLATGKFEQEYGTVNFERALLHTPKRRMMSAPRRRHLNGKTEFYRPSSTHQYMSATDLRSLQDSEENMGKYGRPTRTTLLRARQRTNSAPVNAYDRRREVTRRIEDVRNNSIFVTSKEYLSIYASEGESMHSFLTGARYNRAHLIDSKGLTVYGVYMPRENPTDCFITGQRREKQSREECLLAPPDSPRSDLEETHLPSAVSRPTSSKMTLASRPSSSSRPVSSKHSTKQPSSRPQSIRKSSAKSGSRENRRPRESTKVTSSMRPHPPDGTKRELPVPSEVTLEMPDHINKGKGGVYVTIKGKSMIESVDSKLPRVTGISLPKIRKSMETMDDIIYANQPPPTPVDASLAGYQRDRFSNKEGRSIHQIEENVVDEENAVQEVINDSSKVQEDQENKQNKTGDVAEEITAYRKEKPISEPVEVDNKMTERKIVESGPVKKVNFSDQQVVNGGTDGREDQTESDVKPEEGTDDTGDAKGVNNVTFFVTEQSDETAKAADANVEDAKTEIGNEINDELFNKQSKDENNVEVTENNPNNEIVKSTETENNVEVKGNESVENVIKVEISESDKKTTVEDNNETNESQKPLSSEDFPFEKQD